MIDTRTAPGPADDLLLDVARHADRWYADVVALPPGPAGQVGLARIRDEAVGLLRAGLPDRECAVLLAMTPGIEVDPEMSDDDFSYAAVRVREWLAGMRDGAFVAIAARRAIRRGHPSDPRSGTSGPAAGRIDSPTIDI